VQWRAGLSPGRLPEAAESSPLPARVECCDCDGDVDGDRDCDACIAGGCSRNLNFKFVSRAIHPGSGFSIRPAPHPLPPPPLHLHLLAVESGWNKNEAVNTGGALQQRDVPGSSIWLKTKPDFFLVDLPLCHCVSLPFLEVLSCLVLRAAFLHCSGFLHLTEFSECSFVLFRLAVRALLACWLFVFISFSYFSA